MKLNPTVALTFILLALMFGAGMVSGTWGFAVGREALKGITQPDVRPTSNVGNRKPNTANREQMLILKEPDILKSVKARIEGKGGDAQKNENQNAEQKNEQSAKPASDSTTAAQSGLEFPLSSKDRGVTMEVSSATASEESVLLNVSLKNEGTRAVKFLYSFLDVKDERGRTLNASTDGLPGELPPNGESFSGTLKISTAVLDKAQKLSLKLTDYPDQQLQLQLSGIPVVR